MKRPARIAACLFCSLLAHLLVLGIPARQDGGGLAYRVVALRDTLQARLELDGERRSATVEAPPFVASAGNAINRTQEAPVMVQADAHGDATREGLSLPAPQAFDSPPALLSGLELESAQRPDTAGFVINFRILVGADGRAQKVEITSNWLDKALAQDLVRQLEHARYRPAVVGGRAVSAELKGGLALDEEEKGPADAGPGNSLSTQR